MLDPLVVSRTVEMLRALFIPSRCKRYVMDEGNGWRTIRHPVPDAHLVDHSEGRVAVAIPVLDHVALEVDFAPPDADPLEVWHAIFDGGAGFAAWCAVREAGEALGVPQGYWRASYSGGRSLHFRLLPATALQQADAHCVAAALKAAMEARGQAVCTAYPTNGRRIGKALRLPWGRHLTSRRQGCFVDLGLLELEARPEYHADVALLEALHTNRVPEEVFAEAIALADRWQHEGQETASRQRTTQRPAAGVKVPLQDLTALNDTSRLRPCMARLAASGVPEDMRHDAALYLRADLRHCGFTYTEAEAVYLRYASRCSPQWDAREALADLRLNWSVTDPARRHCCPGRGKANALRELLHDRCCVGMKACVAQRGGRYLSLSPSLTGDAVLLMGALCALEAKYDLRPGDPVRTTAAELMTTAGLTRKRLLTACKEVTVRGLLVHRVAGLGPRSGVYSIYQRRMMDVPVTPPAAVTTAPTPRIGVHELTPATHTTGLLHLHDSAPSRSTSPFPPSLCL